MVSDRLRIRLQRRDAVGRVASVVCLLCFVAENSDHFGAIGKYYLLHRVLLDFDGHRHA